MIERDLNEYSKLFIEYTELRLQENRSVSIGLLNGNPVRNEKSATSGVSARVFKRGAWGFASSPELDGEAPGEVIREATKNAVFLDNREKKSGRSLPKGHAVSQNDFSTHKPRLSQRELIEFVRSVDAHIAESYPSLLSRSAVLRCLDMEKSIITSEGSVSYSMIPRTNVVIVLSVERDGGPVELYEVFGGLGQFEDVFASPADMYSEIASMHEHLMRKSEGVYAQAGPQECVLDADLAGILAHEALGHTTEADIVLGGSVAPDYLGREAASPLVTLIDFAHTALGKTCPVPVHIDDEGSRAEDAVIIDRGVLKGYMHNRESAVRFESEPTGNARAFQFFDEPLIRMRNTAILPGESSLEGMIGSIDEGYYLLRHSNGQADSTGEFMFGVPLGYEIRGGKLGKAIRDTTISGVAFDVLKSVSMVSGDMSWSSGGFCGKKQLIPVGMGGPAIRCRVNIGGR